MDQVAVPSERRQIRSGGHSGRPVHAHYLRLRLHEEEQAQFAGGQRRDQRRQDGSLRAHDGPEKDQSFAQDPAGCR